MTGLMQDMNQAFTTVGRDNFTDIVEPGSQLLTMEFLMSLTVEETVTETKVYFWFFNEQFEMTLKQFSVALGFHKRCILDPNTLAENYEYDHSSWWNLISSGLPWSYTLAQTFASAACLSYSVYTLWRTRFTFRPFGACLPIGRR